MKHNGVRFKVVLLLGPVRTEGTLERGFLAALVALVGPESGAMLVGASAG